MARKTFREHPGVPGTIFLNTQSLCKYRQQQFEVPRDVYRAAGVPTKRTNAPQTRDLLRTTGCNVFRWDFSLQRVISWANRSGPGGACPSLLGLCRNRLDHCETLRRVHTPPQNNVSDGSSRKIKCAGVRLAPHGVVRKQLKQPSICRVGFQWCAQQTSTFDPPTPAEERILSRPFHNPVIKVCKSPYPPTIPTL